MTNFMLHKTNFIVDFQTRLKIAISILIFFTSSIAFSQDLHYSQFEAAPLQLNPALGGHFDGDFRLVTNHRNQWNAITRPYKTFSLTFDGRLIDFILKNTNFGFGLLLNNDKAGDSEFGTSQIGANIAFHQKLTRNGKTMLSFGIIPTYNQRNINYDKLRFNNQFDGNKYDPSLPTGFNPLDDNVSYFDFAIGFQFSTEFARKHGFSLGASFNNLTKPDQSFLGDTDVKLDERMNLHASMKIELHKNMWLLPSFLYMKQGKFKEFNLGGKIQIKTTNPLFHTLYAGTWYRMKDAFALVAGLAYKSVNLGISYDINSSKLNKASRGLGGLELSLIYIFSKPIVKPPKHPCPDFL